MLESQDILIPKPLGSWRYLSYFIGTVSARHPAKSAYSKNDSKSNLHDRKLKTHHIVKPIFGNV